LGGSDYSQNRRGIHREYFDVELAVQHVNQRCHGEHGQQGSSSD
jgi:hypothetical protein